MAFNKVAKITDQDAISFKKGRTKLLPAFIQVISEFPAIFTTQIKASDSHFTTFMTNVGHFYWNQKQ